MLPDYLVEENGGLVQLFGDADTLALDAYLRLSGGTEVGRARPGVPRLPGRQRAALAFLIQDLVSRLTKTQPCRHFWTSNDCEFAWQTCGHRRCAEHRRRILVTSLLHRMHILPESPVRSMFPSGRCCRPPRRQILKPGPSRGPVFSGAISRRTIRLYPPQPVTRRGLGISARHHVVVMPTPTFRP